MQTLAYIFIWFYVRAQPWWVEYQFVQVGTTHHLHIFQIFFNQKYFLKNLFPPNPSYEQTNVFLYASAASVIGAIVFSKGAPYRKPLYSNGSKCFSTDKYFYFVCVCSDHGYLGRGCLCHRHLHVALQLPGLRREAQLQDRPPPRVPNHCCDRNHC